MFMFTSARVDVNPKLMNWRELVWTCVFDNSLYTAAVGSVWDVLPVCGGDNKTLVLHISRIIIYFHCWWEGFVVFIWCGGWSGE